MCQPVSHGIYSFDPHLILKMIHGRISYYYLYSQVRKLRLSEMKKPWSHNLEVGE